MSGGVSLALGLVALALACTLDDLDEGARPTWTTVAFFAGGAVTLGLLAFADGVL